MQQARKPVHKYINGIRHHVTPIGNLPGVTSVLKETKSKYSKMAIEKWVRKVGQEVSEAILKNSVTRGNQLHATIEAFLLDQTPEKLNREAMGLWKLVRPLIEDIKENSSYISVEQPTWHSDSYAGTPDLVCEYKGKLTVFDWKNSRKPKKRSYIKDYLMQAAAYSKSYEQTYGGRVEQAIIVCAVFPDRYLELTDPDVVVEPELQTFEMTAKSIETHWRNFSERLALYKEIQANPWFIDDSIDEDNLIW